MRPDTSSRHHINADSKRWNRYLVRFTLACLGVTSFSDVPTRCLGLNMLQSGLHKQHMKDLFVELCLTVPVRLSSLLPYLPMLMDPLVSALNGSQTLVSQGLRTLELCVDNLQPDFLYDHIQPVRAELMQVGPPARQRRHRAGRWVLAYLVFTGNFRPVVSRSDGPPWSSLCPMLGSL